MRRCIRPGHKMKVSAQTPFGAFDVEVVFCIRNEKEQFFTEVDSINKPKFESTTMKFAAHFDTVADADAFMADARFGGPAIFGGCSVVPSE